MKPTEFYRQIRSERGNRCEICGASGLELHCHHIFAAERFPKFRYKRINLIVVCQLDHRRIENCPSRLPQWKLDDLQQWLLGRPELLRELERVAGDGSPLLPLPKT